MATVAIVDYGVGNLHSIRRGIEMAGAKAVVTGEFEEIERAEGVVLPGVGAFRSAMEKLSKSAGVLQSLSSGKPVLGICLGMQLLFGPNEEGEGAPGLALISGRVVKLPPGCKVPQMGWNSIEILREHPFLDGIKSGAHVYFVHSYYTEPEHSDVVLATTEYCHRFPSVVAKGDIVGTQFHPEKSGKVGLRMLENFVKGLKR